MRRLVITACLALGALAFASGANAGVEPLDQMPDYKPTADSDEGGIWMVMEQAEKDTQRSPLLAHDPALNAYVKKIVCDLAGPHCNSIRPYILEIPEFNASMSANGMMLVYTGLLLRAENEAQLAFVLGHETGHFLERHTLKQFRTVVNTSDFLAFFSLVAAGAGVGYAGNAAALIATGALFSYTRDQEREADERGFKAITAKGYDPRQGAALWADLIEEEKADPKRKKPSQFTATHPTSEERLQTLTRRAAEVQGETKAGVINAEIYHRTMRPFRTQWLEDELGKGKMLESLVVINKLIRAEPQSGELAYFLGEAYRRRNAPGDYEKARAAYQDAIRKDGAPADVHKELGLVAMKSGDKLLARQSFETYLGQAPQADDRKMIEFYLAQLGSQP